MVELELNREGLRLQIRAEADTLPLMTDLVINGPTESWCFAAGSLLLIIVSPTQAWTTWSNILSVLQLIILVPLHRDGNLAARSYKKVVRSSESQSTAPALRTMRSQPTNAGFWGGRLGRD